jgi:ribose-phosphate pyrophosphokinase
VPITARLVADMIEAAGADRYMTLDPHAGQIQGFFSIPGDVLTASHMLVDHINQTLRARCKTRLSSLWIWDLPRKGATMPQISMRRSRSSRNAVMGNDAKAEALTLIGDVKNRDVIIVDDEVDTGGSIAQAVDVVKKYGARDVYLAFIHPILSADGAARLASLPIKQIITTNSVPLSPEKLKILEGKITILSIAPLLGEVIRRAHEGRSVGEMFNE